MTIEKTIKGQVRKCAVLLLFLLSAISLRSQDTIVYVFKETFENIENLNQSTIADKWQIRQTVYTESSQEITKIGGEHGKVWTSVYHDGKAAGYGDDGFVVDPVIGEFDELWFESDLFADPDFNPSSISGKYSSKMLFGFLGGNQYLGDRGWVLDSSATGNGWTAQLFVLRLTYFYVIIKLYISMEGICNWYTIRLWLINAILVHIRLSGQIRRNAW